MKLAREHGPAIALGALAFTAFVFYAVFRARHVGACDTYAYLSQSLLFRGLDPFGGFDPTAHPASMPYCHSLVAGEAVPLFPPGFSLILAVAGLVGLEQFVDPLLGAASIVLMYLAVAPRAGRGSALLVSLMWSVMPMLVFGSVELMSDLAATVAMLGAWVLLSRNQPVWAGAVIGFSLGIRPANLLFALPLLGSGPTRRQLLRFAAGAAPTVAAWAVFELVRFGDPRTNPYVAMNESSFGLTPLFAHQLSFIVVATLAMCWPAVIGAAAALLRPRDNRALWVWFVGSVVFYSLWTFVRYDTWWRMRFLLSGYAALFVLAGAGIAEVARRWERRWPGLARGRLAFGLVVAAACVIVSARFMSAHRAFLEDPERSYALDSQTIAQLVPPTALVGAYDFTGPIRLYGERESFNWRHPMAFDLVGRALEEQRPLYFVIEPGRHDDPFLRQGLAGFDLVPVAPLTQRPGLWLLRLLPRESGACDASVVASTGVEGLLSALVDGVVPLDGTPAHTPVALQLVDTESVVTLALARPVVATDLLVTAQGEDTIPIEGSRDGATFFPLATVPRTSAPGLATRRVRLASGGPLSHLRVRGRHSIAELRLVDACPTATVTGVEGTRGDRQLATDGVAPPPGSPWDASALVLDGPSSWVTFRVASGQAIGVRAIVDGNDVYAVSGSHDGVLFEAVGTLEGPPLFGLQARSLLFDRAFSFLRIAPLSGDGSFSLAEATPLEAPRHVHVVPTQRGDRATADVDLEPGVAYRLWAAIDAPAGATGLSIDVRVDGTVVDTIPLAFGSGDYSALIPVRARGGPARIELALPRGGGPLRVPSLELGAVAPTRRRPL